MLQEILEDAKNSMDKSLTALENNFKKIRTGRANTSLLDAIKVDYYGNLTPLNQLANLSVEDAKTIAIVPWDCLLYTSPSPRDATLSRMPSSA